MLCILQAPISDVSRAFLVNLPLTFVKAFTSLMQLATLFLKEVNLIFLFCSFQSQADQTKMLFRGSSLTGMF